MVEDMVREEPEDIDGTEDSERWGVGGGNNGELVDSMQVLEITHFAEVDTSVKPL